MCSLLSIPYSMPPTDMNVLQIVLFQLSIVLLRMLKMLIHARLNLFTANFWKLSMLNVLKICRVILVVVFFAYLSKVCNCEMQSTGDLTLATKTKDVEELRFLKGTTATFVCPLTLQSSSSSGNFARETENDPAYLIKALKVVFFHKGRDSQSPLIIYDNRDTGKPFHKVHLNKEMTGETTNTSETKTARFRINIDYLSKTATLVINKVVENDEGLYHCRVDYRWSGTTRKKFRMELIVPPQQMIIQDTTNLFVTKTIGKDGIIGPYAEESSQVQLACVVNGAKPEPFVRWYEGTTLLDDQIEHTESEHGFRTDDTFAEEIDQPENFKNAHNDGAKKRHRVKRMFTSSKLSFEYHHESVGLVNCTNKLYVEGKLTRKDFRRKFRCVAGNTKLVPPIEKEVMLDMLLRPVNAKIVVGSTDAFVAGHNAGLVCRSTGSKPFARLSWYKKGVQIADKIEGHFDAKTNDSISTLRFRPTIEDDNAEFECHATNIELPEEIGTVRDSIRIRVQYFPQLEVVLSYSSPLFDQNESSETNRLLVEGTKVQLYCNIRSNPPLNSSIIWVLNGQQLDSYRCGLLNCSINGALLTIPSLKDSLHSGDVNCYGENAIGRGLSKPFSLVVSYAPQCKPNQTTVYRAAINETVLIECQVTAHPNISLYYDWYINASRPETEHSGANAAMFRYSRKRTLMHKPKNRFDYGTFSCAAHNTVGHMTEEQLCVYTLLPYSRPDPVNWCIAEQVLSSDADLEQVIFPNLTFNPDLNLNATIQLDELVPFTITCKFSYNGGLDQTLCAANITRINDSVRVWTGNSSYARLLSDGLTYECVFNPEMMLDLVSQYRFSVTSVNEVGLAVTPFTFTSSINSRALEMKMTIKEDFGNKDDQMSPQWETNSSVASSGNSSKGNNQVNTLKIAAVEIWKHVASFILQAFTTLPASCSLALMVGLYYLSHFTSDIAKLRYARDLFYSRFAGYQTQSPEPVIIIEPTSSVPGRSIRVPMNGTGVNGLLSETVSATVTPTPSAGPSLSALQYSAQMGHAHRLNNGRTFMPNEFSWIDPFDDCDEYHLQESEDDHFRAKRMKAMDFLLKIGNKREWKREKKAAAEKDVPPESAVGLDSDSNVANGDKGNIFSKLFCQKKKGAQNQNQNRSDNKRVNSYFAFCNTHSPYTTPVLPCAECALASLESAVPLTSISIINNSDEQAHQQFLGSNNFGDSFDDSTGYGSGKTEVLTMTNVGEFLQTAVKDLNAVVNEEYCHSEMNQPIYENFTPVIEQTSKFSAVWLPSGILYPTGANCNLNSKYCTCLECTTNYLKIN